MKLAACHQLWRITAASVPRMRSLSHAPRTTSGHACMAGAQGLLQAARFPLDKRPLQLHNLNLALAALRKAGIDAKVCGSLRDPSMS